VANLEAVIGSRLGFEGVSDAPALDTFEDSSEEEADWEDADQDEDGDPTEEQEEMPLDTEPTSQLPEADARVDGALEIFWVPAEDGTTRRELRLVSHLSGLLVRLWRKANRNTGRRGRGQGDYLTDCYHLNLSRRNRAFLMAAGRVLERNRPYFLGERDWKRRLWREDLIEDLRAADPHLTDPESYLSHLLSSATLRLPDAQPVLLSGFFQDGAVVQPTDEALTQVFVENYRLVEMEGDPFTADALADRVGPLLQTKWERGGRSGSPPKAKRSTVQAGLQRLGIPGSRERKRFYKRERKLLGRAATDEVSPIPMIAGAERIPAREGEDKEIEERMERLYRFQQVLRRLADHPIPATQQRVRAWIGELEGILNGGEDGC
jgi:hypothetical protein